MKVGIITFHASYNYGSVLQALATQQAISNLGYETEIIDYRPITYDYYDRIYCERGHQSRKGKLLLFLINRHKQERLLRINNFNSFCKQYYNLTTKRYYNLTDLTDVSEKYDFFVSGSDQIWSNKVPEIQLAGKDAELPYFLSFTNKRKIAYASSVASMTEEQLEIYNIYLNKYSYLSTRESVGAKRLFNVTKRNIELVLDPSFLLNNDEWHKYYSYKPIVKDKYVLLYSLRNYEAQKNWIKALKVFAKRNKLKIVVVAPYFSLPMQNVINIRTAGPAEFLNLYANAEVICTDTFHGTAFAVNFNKPFFSLGTKYWKEDIRKKELLEWVGLENRIIEDEMNIANIQEYNCNFAYTNQVIKKEREYAYSYLRKVLKY